MNLFVEAYLNINDDPQKLTDKGSELLYDILEHFCEGGTVDDFYLEPAESAYILAMAMRTVRKHLAS